jgi:UDP-N-acetylmuramoyl-L-alanyl-D-glutamate--2,6-diaminopimelate ligase
MKLSHIISSCKYKRLIGTADRDVKAISIDSRTIENNMIFVAIRGVEFDGHDFIEKAIEKGATVIVADSLSKIEEGITYLEVENTSIALGHLASAFFNHPSTNIEVVGVTGTNGKTTIATQLYHLFTNMGFKVGLLSTIENRIGTTIIPTKHTTPDAITIQSLLHKMVEEGCSYCFMEVSSHSVIQNRIEGVEFTGTIFTNLTHDHLDYHSSFAEYRDVKKYFFDKISSSAFALSNLDDTNGQYMLQNTKSRKKYYSLKKVTDYKGLIVENSIEGLQMRINGHDVHFRMRGEFNAYNLLAIYGTAIELGFNDIEVLEQMSLLTHVEGRFDVIENKKGIFAIVDYAHTPDAIENILKTVASMRSHNEKLIVVVGAGGNRDASKRPEMARIAIQYADLLILTSDNPRYEDANKIIDEMKLGINKSDEMKTMTISDRREAIKAACMFAKDKDIIVVAGKGHEKYQEIHGVKYEFDDKKVLMEFLSI